VLRALRRGDDHAWSQEHLSHYVEGDLSWRARRRLELHAEECPDCNRGIRAVRALLRLMHASANRASAAPADIFERVRADAARGGTDVNQAREP
jgi:anti-sigma factor RsiW